MKKFLTASSLIYLLKIVKVSNKSFSYGHAMEELAELQIECSKMNRGKARHKHFRKELGDVFFHLLKLMLKHKITMDDLINDLTVETIERFPEQIKEVEDGNNNKNRTS